MADHPEMMTDDLMKKWLAGEEENQLEDENRNMQRVKGRKDGLIMSTDDNSED